MEPIKQELQAGSWIQVLVDNVINDTLVVTLSYADRKYSGILIDCSKKSGLFCLPSNELSTKKCPYQVDGDQELVPQSELQFLQDNPSKQAEHEQFSPISPSPGATSIYPPYFEGAPFPHPLWLRHTYNQWIPQPPLRTVKTPRRRLSRNRDSGKLIMSSIRLRPRQVLCERCKATLSSNEDNKDEHNTSPPNKTTDTQDKDQQRSDELETADKMSKTESKEDCRSSDDSVHRSPIIKISYSTPQGRGEVIEIPSRVHGSQKPICSRQLMQNDFGDNEKNRDVLTFREVKDFAGGSASSPVNYIPKLKLVRPVHSSNDAPPPKIRLKPHQMRDGERLSIYRAEIVEDVNCSGHPRNMPNRSTMHSEESTDRSSADISSGSSEEEEDFKMHCKTKGRHNNLTLLLDYKRRKADSSTFSVCSSDSLDESKSSSSSDALSLEVCDLTPGDDFSVSSSLDENKSVPPLTVRLNARSVKKCVTDEGKTVSVGDVVWGKIHGCPWWPARILNISISKRGYGNPSWKEAKVEWFGSPTTSVLSVSKLSPFSEYFKLRFNRKKKGVYRKAVAEAAKATAYLNPEIGILLSRLET